MNAFRLVRSTPVLLPFLCFAAFAAQKQTPAPPPQTARQALLEMLTKGPEAVTKHLTVDVQEFLKQPENLQSKMTVGLFSSFKNQPGELQPFESGPVLLAITEPDRHQKTEFRLENDDLNGDQDVLQLSLHVLRDGQEQHEIWSSLLSHFTVTMIRQQGIWRLSNLGVGIDVPLGDPEFLKSLDAASNRFDGIGMVGGGMAVGVPNTHQLGSAAPSGNEAHETANTTVRPADLPPELVVSFLAAAEGAFAREHAEQGFTCSLPDLAQITVAFGVDPEISAGTYKGYRVNLIGCVGKPAGSFQITLEPVSPAAGSKAYCVDATQNVRYSEDGRGATCLSAGVAEQTAQEE
jgi:hypothetical protein